MGEASVKDKLALLLCLSLVLIAPTFGGAQDADQCSALVDKAFTALGQSCENLDRNSACYGYNRVDATFQEAVADDFFTQSGDTTELTPLETIQTYGLDEALERWGIALMRVQANIPNTLPGQAVIFMLLGDSAAQNAVAADDALTPSDLLVDVTASVNANLRSAPGFNANVIEVADSGTVLQADALSDGLDWLRVLVNDAPAWINREVVSAAADLDALPVIAPEARTPMQAFYFTTRASEVDCAQAPDTLLIQGPQNMTIDLQANQASIQIGSTVLLSMVDDDTMQLVVLDGQADIDNLVVPEGFKAFAPLRQPDENEAQAILLPDGKIADGPWDDCQPIPAEELAAYESLENIPPELLNYPITIPEEQEGDCVDPSAPNQSTAGACGLTIPGPAAGRANCCGFAATAPSGSIAYDNVSFAWNPAGGATSYQLNFFTAAEGRYVTSFNTAGAETSLNIFTPGLTDGSDFVWEVSALVDGQVACTTTRVGVTRTPGGGSSGGGGSTFVANVCGNGVCEPANGEDISTCMADC
jgi:hypothetical protein